MKLIWKNETVILRIGGKLVKMEAGADVEVEFPKISRLRWLRAELRRVMKGGK